MTKDPQTLNHLDDRGAARMVDISDKEITHRVAVAEATVWVGPEAAKALLEGEVEKGDALAVARIAGISASKKTAELIPLAHPIGLTHVSVDISMMEDEPRVRIEARVETTDRTGVEMEAMTAASVSALALYDMVKAIEREAVIEKVRLVFKAGGKSGTFHRGDPKAEATQV